MKKIQIFISYCGADSAKMHDLRDNYLLKIKEDYVNKDVDVVICEMETDCAHEWDAWMVGAVKQSEILVCILTDNTLYPKDFREKRVLEELRVARDNALNIVPVLFNGRGLPDEYQAHIGRISQIWYANGETQEQIFSEVEEKVRLLLDKIVSGNKIRQYESVKIIGCQFSKFAGFVGREKEMEEISEKFKESNLVILKGEGGIGKTCLAKAFFNNTKNFDRAYIIDASSGIKQTIQNFPFEDTQYLNDATERYNGNLKRLNELSEKTIIILDNYDEEGEGDIETIAQLDAMSCRYVITSRIGAEPYEEYTIELGRMPDEDLIELVYKNFPKIESVNELSKQEVEALLKEFFANVNGLTIAVELASAVMRDGDVSLTELNQAMLTCNDRVSSGRNVGKRASAMDHLSSLYSYAKLSEEEHDVLKVLTHISPVVGIKRKELRKFLNLESNDVINELIRKTFIRLDESNIITMHPLMSDVYYKCAKVAENDDLTNILNYVSGIDFNKDKSLTLTEASLKNIATYKYLVEKRKNSFKGDDLSIKLGLYDGISRGFNVIAGYQQSLLYCKKVLEICNLIYADTLNHPDVATSYNNLGYAYLQIGDYANALNQFLEACAIYERCYLDTFNSPYLATGYISVGSAYAGLGDNKESLKYFFKALEIYEKIYEALPNHQDMAICYNNIASAYKNLGNYKSAFDFCLKAFEINEELYAKTPYHPALAVAYLNIGRAYGDLGDTPKFLEYCLKALEIRKHLFIDNPNHPALANVYISLCYAYGEFGDLNRSLEYGLKALEIFKLVYSNNSNNQNLANGYNAVGRAYLELGEYQLGLENCLKALEIRKARCVNNPNHPALATNYSSVSLAYKAIGEYEKALEYCLKALEIRKLKYADNLQHPDLAASYNSVGVIYRHLGEYKKSLENCLKALEIRKNVYAFNPNHPMLAISYNNIGLTNRCLDNAREGLENCLKALEMRKKAYSFNPNHYSIAGVYNNIGLDKMGLSPEERLQNSLKALELRKKTYSRNPNHPALAASFDNVGLAYRDLGKEKEGLDNCLKALEIRKVAYLHSPNHPDLAKSYFNVGEIYFRVKDYESALDYLLEALKIRKVFFQNISDVDGIIKDINGSIAKCYEALGNMEEARFYYDLLEE